MNDLKKKTKQKKTKENEAKQKTGRRQGKGQFRQRYTSLYLEFSPCNYSGLFYCPTFPLPRIVKALTKRLFQACFKSALYN